MSGPKKSPDTKKSGSVKIIRGKSGRFEKGFCPNPNGRTLGSRNKTTLAAQAMFYEQADEICRATLDLAVEEKYWPALKTALERILPRLKSPPLAFEMSPMETPEDLITGHREVIDALSRGDLSVEEAKVFESLLEGMVCAMGAADLSKRVAALEASSGDEK